MNTIYLVTYSPIRGLKGQKKVKEFENGKMEEAMAYGWKLADSNKNNEYFIKSNGATKPTDLQSVG